MLGPKETIQKDVLKYTIRIWRAKAKLKRKCWGCKGNLANQQAHMTYGGCLYIPDLDSLYQ
jgi:hypothetical protein